MLYTFRNGKILTNSIEYSAAYHCNLMCTHCSHLSPFMDARLPSVESYKKDLFGLSEVMHAKIIRLLGGEPLLNPDIGHMASLARQSGIADRIMVTTNGLLLHRMTDIFWENVDDVLVCLYPGIELKETFGAFKEKAKMHGVRIYFQFIGSFRTTIVSSPHKKDWITDFRYRSCRDAHLFHCHMIHEGMLYKCAVPPFLSSYLASTNKEYDPVQDGFDIHNSSDLAGDLERYLTDRHTKEACRYCLGYLGKKTPHRQLPANSNPGSTSVISSTPVTRNNSLDYMKLVKEISGFISRRLVESLSGKKKW